MNKQPKLFCFNK